MSFQLVNKDYSYIYVLQYLSTSMIIAYVHYLLYLLLLQLFISHLYFIF